MIRFWSIIYDLVSPFAPVSVKGWLAIRWVHAIQRRHPMKGR